MRFLREAALSVGVFFVLLGVQGDAARAAWPPAPDADFSDPTNWPNDPGYGGRWNYWSFLPKQDVGTEPYLGADLGLGASGMSIDKAWVTTTGRADVVIAVVDSGIKWDSADIANKAWLNKKELIGVSKPENASAQPCAGLAGYDCDGDGVFTVADYKDDPRFTPIMTGEKCSPGMDPDKPSANDRIKGDVNRNCILDAGDLIEMFSDGVDDDANGYVDDISGWDFYRNDNNAYDDTRYGHGTGEANDSVAQGNNGIDTIGTCPKCMFFPMRVGESFIADVNDFAKSVIYATDNGAKIIQEALGTLDQTAFSKAAIDYAYANGVIVDASMADENSRHHNLPAVANHTLPVHTVRFNGDNFHNSSTFLAFDSCTNYGGHGGLSVSGTSCASEATGRAAGIMGLIYSAGLDAGLTLSAEEVMQILKMSADDISVPESLAINPATGLAPFYESRPGWDQRFNYGRMNAFKAVARAKAGTIPPEVDIVSPTWYAPIYADRVGGSVAIYGSVTAKRAKSYDYAVEWAPGVQPADADFKPLIADVVNVPGGDVSGGPTVQLATFDPRSMPTQHTLDMDSPQRCTPDKSFCWGPNDRTVTLRVRAIAHYTGEDVPGEARRTIAITNALNGTDDDLLPGFPIDTGSSVEANGKMADIDGDGVRDLILPTSNGDVHVWSLRNGGTKEVAGFPYRTLRIDGLNAAITDPLVPSYQNGLAYVKGKNGGVDPDIAREAILNAPAVADLDGDGKSEIVISTWAGTIYVIDRNGKDLAGWPKRLPLVPSCPLDPAKPKPPGDCMDLKHSWSRGAYASPVLADMDKDGKLDIVQAAFDGNIYVYKADGSMVSGWPVRVTSPKATVTNRIMTTPAVVDLDKNGYPELVTGSNEEIGGGGGAGNIYVIDGRGTNAPEVVWKNWPVTITSIKLFPVVAQGIDGAPAVADFDGDGVGDVAGQGNGAPPYVFKSDPGAQIGFSDPPNRLPIKKDGTAGFEPTSNFGPYTQAAEDTFFPLFSVPTIGDLDQDGTPDLIMSGGSLSLIGSLAGQGRPSNAQHLLSAWSGKTGAMMPGLPALLEDFQFLINHSVADLNGDDYPEIITGSGVYFVHAVDACGMEPKGWPKFTNGWVASSPVVGDVDGDGTLELTTATRNGYVFAWHTKGRQDGVIQWESFHHDNRNTGNYDVPLDQGVVKKAAKPIDCTRKPPVTKLDIGGCGCSSANEKSDGAVVALGALAIALIRRRRKSFT